MGFLADKRTELHEAIGDVFDAPVAGFTFSGRVDRTQPTKLAAPRAFIGDGTGVRVRTANAPVYVAGFPVYVVHDGSVAAQVNGIDEIVGRIHDAAVRAGFDVTGHGPASLPAEITPPANARTSIVNVEVSARGLTLCTPPKP